MIDIHPDTGATITGRELLYHRFKRLVSTQVADRIKRRFFGNPAIDYLGDINNPHTENIIQNLTFKALSEPANGLTDFKATACSVDRTSTGFVINVSGVWNGESLQLGGPINGSP